MSRDQSDPALPVAPTPQPTAFDQLFAERQLPVEEVAEVLADVAVRVIIHGQDAANPMGTATPSLKEHRDQHGGDGTQKAT